MFLVGLVDGNRDQCWRLLLDCVHVRDLRRLSRLACGHWECRTWCHIGLIWGLWAWGVNRLTNMTSMTIQWAAPLTMVTLECVFPRVFPAAMGNSQFPFIHLMQIADIVGVAGVTFLIYWENAVAFVFLRALIERRAAHRLLKITAVILACVLITAFFVNHIDDLIAKSPKLPLVLLRGMSVCFCGATRKATRPFENKQRLSAKLPRRGWI